MRRDVSLPCFPCAFCGGILTEVIVHAVELVVDFVREIHRCVASMVLYEVFYVGFLCDLFCLN